MNHAALAMEAVKRCRAVGRGDDEAAHAAEDEAREHALLAFMDKDPAARVVAAEVLALRDLKFERWCA